MTTLERDPAATGRPSASPPPPAPRRELPPRSPLWLLVGLLSSMRLTVVLLLLLAALTFTGTLAQTQDGIYYVQKQYFESWFVLVPAALGLKLPLPGALPVMGLLFVNLLVGGVVRLKLHLRNAGVLIAHLGIALLLVAGFVKLEMSDVGFLTLYEQQTGSLLRSMHEWEVALLRRDGDGVVERTLPGAAVEAATGDHRLRVDDPTLPFVVELHDFAEHCAPMYKGPMFQADAPVVNGVFLARDKRFIGAVPAGREQKLAGCYATIVDRDGGRSRQAILWAGDMLRVGTPMRPFTFEVGGQSWGLELRHQVSTLPFDVRLDDFQKSDHPGSGMVRDYSSFVTVTETSGASRPVHIYMNEPLRKDGYVFYQSSWGPPDSLRGPFYSTFEVASNPSDKWPEIACWVIFGGMALHFLLKVSRFVSAESRRRLQESRA